jgi:hypothetical protein
MWLRHKEDYMYFKGFRSIFAFLALLLATGLACSVFTGSRDTPAGAPQVEQPPAQQSQELQPQEQPSSEQSGDSTGDFVTFTDQNDLYSIEVPADWVYTQTVDTEDNNYYIDTFKSPDNGAVIENIVYDDGTPFTGSQNGKFALYLLNTFYSSTGKEGDIRVTDDSIMKDKSERLTWTSKEGGYTGISFFEVRKNKTTFLLFTVDWGNDVKDTYSDVLNYVIESYSIP